MAVLPIFTSFSQSRQKDIDTKEADWKLQKTILLRWITSIQLSDDERITLIGLPCASQSESTLVQCFHSDPLRRDKDTDRKLSGLKFQKTASLWCTTFIQLSNDKRITLIGLLYSTQSVWQFSCFFQNSTCPAGIRSAQDERRRGKRALLPLLLVLELWHLLPIWSGITSSFTTFLELSWYLYSLISYTLIKKQTSLFEEIRPWHLLPIWKIIKNWEKELIYKSCVSRLLLA